MLAALQLTHGIADRLRDHSGIDVLECDWQRANVHTSRAWPLTEDGLPAWRVFPGPEAMEPLTIHANPTLQHDLDIVLEGVVRQVSELDERLGRMAAQALTAVFGAALHPDALAALSGSVQLQPTGIQRIPVTEGEAAIGRVLITLRARYRTKAGAPETIL